MLNRSQLTTPLLLTLLLTAGLSSCATKSTVNAPQSTASPTSERPTPAVPSEPLTTVPDSSALTTDAAPDSGKTIPITLYKADSQCASFVPEQVQVSEARSLESAVGKVIQAQSSSDFDLSGYRVSQDADGIVTIDFRLAPNADRQFTSLSSCEQFALFGSIRETLSRNPQWQVKSVRFTNRGEAIVL